jgi:hypothetical protein
MANTNTQGSSKKSTRGGKIRRFTVKFINLVYVKLSIRTYENNKLIEKLNKIFI